MKVASGALEGIKVVDADSHMTERHDLFLSRAPARYADRVPHVERIDGEDMWVIEGQTFGKAGSGGTIDPDGNKHPFFDSMGGSWGIDDGHAAAWDWQARLALMDEVGIDTQVIYPNSIGLGGQNLVNHIADRALLRLCIEIYNDAMAEMQAASANRLLPMPIMPAWDIAECVREAERCAALDLRGVNMTADPQDSGSPDLGDPAWDPFWEVCAGLKLPVHFHIGASQSSLAYFGTTFWPSQDEPSEYFRDNWWATFWFETGRGDLQHLVDAVGEDKVMFETDFPHPTCLHPHPVEMVSEKMAALRPESQRKIMGGNAAALYRL